MTNHAGVTNKLKCVIFQLNWELIQKKTYGIDCNVDVIAGKLSLAQQYLSLLNISILICRSLECKILSLLDEYTFTLCVRDTTEINIA